MDKKRKIIIISLISLFFIGSILILIGFYYWVVKAGIPYQDPTPEMLYRYYQDMRIGDITLLVGFGMIMVDILLSIICYIKIFRKKDKENK